MAVDLTKLWKGLKKTDSIDDIIELTEHKATEDVYALKVKKGRFKGVVFCFGEVRFSINESTDELDLKFKTFVLENPRRCDIQSNKFQKFTGDVLVYFLQQSQTGDGQITTDYVKEDNLYSG